MNSIVAHSVLTVGRTNANDMSQIALLLEIAVMMGTRMINVDTWVPFIE
jgi:hypothetical protein